MKTCAELRGDGCDTVVQAHWRQCPKCGAVLGRVEAQERALWRVTDERTVGKVRLTFQGQEAIEVRTTLVGDEKGAFEAPGASFVVNSDMDVEVQVDPARCQSPARAALEITTRDGVRGPNEMWIPRPERTHYVELEAALAEGPMLVAEPGVLLFAPGQERRVLELVNRGDLPAHIDVIQAPAGVRAQGALENRLIEPEGRTRIVVECAEGAQAGDVEFRDHGKLLLSVPLLHLPAPPPKIVSRYVVGIDFGTSNTTIGIRDTQTEQNEFLSDPGAPTSLPRFPSVVLLRGPDSLGWAYGSEALTEFDPNKHQIVHELKNYLRENREPFAAKWSTCTIDAILAWYLRRLRLGIIEPGLARLSPQAAADAHIVFCLPVLDAGPQYELQRSRMERAIGVAGYRELGEVTFQFEPVAAALYFLQGHKSGAPVHSFDDGDSILVFDSGGGTTDIALFTARERSGEVAMEDVTQVGSHKSDDAGAVQFNQFGGTTLTQLIGFYKDCDLKSQGLPNRMLAFANQYDARRYESFDQSLALTQGGFVSIVPKDAPDGGESLRWHRRFPRTYRLFELLKRKVAPKAEKADGEVVISDKLGPDVILYRQDIDLIVDVEMKKILKPMLADLMAGGVEAESIRHVFPVGGNSNIPRIQHWLRKEFSERQLAQITPDQRMMAVPIGALYAYDATVDRPPYDVEIIDQTSGRLLVDCTGLFTLRGASMQKQVRLAPRQSFFMEARAKRHGETWTLATIELRNEGTSPGFVEWRVRLEASEVILDARTATGWTERWRYEL